MVCGFKTENKVFIKDHIQNHYNEKIVKAEIAKAHKCTSCDFRTNSLYHLKNHLKTHTDQPKLQCSHCDFQTRLVHTLKQHSLIHTGHAPYKCDLCDYGVYRRKNLEAHINKVHTHTKPYKCDTCDYRATTKDILLKHVKRCSGIKSRSNSIFLNSLENCRVSERNVCDPAHSIDDIEGATKQNTVDEENDRNSDLTNAELIIINVPPLVCNLCEFSFTEELEFNEHMSCHIKEEISDPSEVMIEQVNNTIENEYVSLDNEENVDCLKSCGVCDFHTYKIMDLQRHVLQSHIECLKCITCAYTCQSLKQLVGHHMSVHQMKYYYCKYCQYYCSKKLQYNEHVSSHQKKFKCQKCDFETKYKRMILEHNFLHTNMKPYKCGCCDFQSCRASNLIRHQYVHTVEKPLKCLQCSYSTTQKKCLNAHVKKHNEG